MRNAPDMKEESMRLKAIQNFIMLRAAFQTTTKNESSQPLIYFNATRLNVGRCYTSAKTLLSTS